MKQSISWPASISINSVNALRLRSTALAAYQRRRAVSEKAGVRRWRHGGIRLATK
jgi:hypothetical protein